MTSDTKCCTKCNRGLPLTAFGPDNRPRAQGRQRGRQSQCRECRNVASIAVAKLHKREKSEYDVERRRQKYEQIRAYDRNRYARNGGAPGPGLSLEEWDGRIKEFGGRCAYCGRIAALSQDHVQPISTGGEHTIENVVPACKHCNSSKHDDSPLLWIAKRGRRKRGRRIAMQVAA